jgi:hypothetical protein
MVLRNVSLLFLVLGLALLAYMIPVEGEPGALPLGLVLFGTIGFIVSRLRAKRSTPSRPR